MGVPRTGRFIHSQYQVHDIFDFIHLLQTRKIEKEANLKPVTPSKIPVGSFRVEEEKAINRALNGQQDSNRKSSRGSSPPSRIPKFSASSNYVRVKVSN